MGNHGASQEECARKALNDFSSGKGFLGRFEEVGLCSVLDVVRK